MKLKLSIRREYFGWLAAICLGSLSAWVPYLLKPRFYFFDDVQHAFLPTAYNIGEMLHRGDVPWLSLRLWQAGNYILEYQWALFNPFSLFQYYLLLGCTDHYLSAFLYAAPYLVICSFGTYLVARELGLSRVASCLAAFCVSSNNYLLYWNAASWHNMLVAFCWLPLTWFFAIRSIRSAWYILACSLGVYLIATAGSPQGGIALAILFIGIATEYLFVRRDRLAAISITVSLGSGLLLAAPSYFPLAAVILDSPRQSGIWNHGVLVPTLSDMLQLSNPSYLGHTFAFQPGRHLDPVPHYYAAWFILPLLPLLRWQRSNWTLPGMPSCAISGAIFLFMSLWPEQLGPLRWPIRFIPYVHLVVVLGFIMVALRPNTLMPSPKRLVTSMLLVAIQTGLAWQQAPEWIAWHLLVGLLIGLGTVYFLVQDAERILGYWLLLMSMVFFGITQQMFGSNLGIFEDWAQPQFVEYSARGQRASASESAPATYTLYAANLDKWPESPGILGEYRTGATFLNYGERAINGYSPIGHAVLTKLMCMAPFGGICQDGLLRVLEQDQVTGKTFADLMRLDRIVVRTSPEFTRADQALRKQWTLEQEGQYTRTYSRVFAAFPGTISSMPAQLQLNGSVLEGSTRETARITAETGFKGGIIVFARLWWPGYRATLDGVALETFAHKGIFVAVRIPPWPASGALELEYVPVGLREGLITAGIGAVVLISVLIFRIRKMQDAHPG